VLTGRFGPSRLVEYLTAFLLFIVRVRLGRRWWHGVNVHVAYPLLRFVPFFRWLFGQEIVLTEHWSAYRQGFNLSESSAGRRRIAKSFCYGIPVVAISKALMTDIIKFAGQRSFAQFIVPNAVNQEIFTPAPAGIGPDNSVFLMTSSWSPIKRPFLIMRAFKALLVHHPQAQLRIIGYGTQWAQMEEFVKFEKLEGAIKLLGPLQKTDVAHEMRQASVFVHASDYETFSVVCAEALCCGTPVIASNVGGIPEFINATNGILLPNTEDDWVRALRDFMDYPKEWDRKGIAAAAAEMFDRKSIGRQLTEVYKSVF
jgi:L-malate glycosyltransferase